MIEKPDPHSRLVAEVFNEDWTSGPAGAFALRAAAHARRRRTVRHALVAGGAATVVITALFFSAGLRTPSPRPVVSGAVPVAAIPRSFEIISDEELIAELRDRPLLVLPQEAGAKKFVLLDR